MSTNQLSIVPREETILGSLAFLLALIHPSAWNWNSANFALTEFSEIDVYVGCSRRSQHLSYEVAEGHT